MSFNSAPPPYTPKPETVPDYYETLGVGRNAPQEEIKKVYRNKAMKYHPDTNGAKSEQEKKIAEQKFKKANEAYETLHDKTKREAYDRLLRAEQIKRASKKEDEEAEKIRNRREQANKARQEAKEKSSNSQGKEGENNQTQKQENKPNKQEKGFEGKIELNATTIFQMLAGGTIKLTSTLYNLLRRLWSRITS